VVEHPIRLTVTDDLERNRWTVFFRIFLAIPLFIWLYLWGVVAFFAAIVNWLVTLVSGRSPDSLFNFLAAYARYLTHVYAYVFLAANPYPGFSSDREYPVDVEFGESVPQNRWKTGFRVILALPALALAAALVDATPSSYTASANRGGGHFDYQTTGGGVALTVAVLAWFAILARGRMPRGFRDLVAYCLRFGIQTCGYLFVLTDRYPDADPALPESFEPAPASPVRLSLADDPRRSRLTVFFRLLLAIPHLVWLSLWAIAAVFALIAMWFATLVTGRPPAGLHRFLSSYLRYATHVSAFLFLIGGPFPAFNGRAGSYPVDLELPGPEPQGRWGVFFRVVLAVPAIAVAAALGGALVVSAVLCWFASLVTAREPLGLQRLGAFALRYALQNDAYLYLLTDRYPYSGPATQVAAEQLTLAE
jgi:Domain of unknown function (DUF4389)